MRYFIAQPFKRVSLSYLAERQAAGDEDLMKQRSGAPKQPLAEVFGFPIDNFSPDAERHRRLKLCPYNNKSPNCTKSRAKNPIGVCSVLASDQQATITCPIRFREAWYMVEHAAAFFFPQGAQFTSLMEVPLNDKHGKSAGNIDVVLVSYDEGGRLTGYGSLEVQAVYVSGTISTPFQHYMSDPTKECGYGLARTRELPTSRLSFVIA